MITEVSKGREYSVPSFRGLSTDSKPTDAGNGAEFIEINTGDVYYYNEAGSAWVKYTGSEGGGGGGSSDFSTAEVNIINDTGSAVDISDCPQVVDDEYMSGGISIDANTEATLSLILYKGHAFITAIAIGGTPMVGGTGITVTGDIVNESDEYEVYIEISGDGTITITSGGGV